MGHKLLRGRPSCLRLLGGLAISVSGYFLVGEAPAQQTGKAPQNLPQAATKDTKTLPAVPENKARNLTLDECLDLAMEKQPALKAHRASLAAARTLAHALANTPNLIIAPRDLDIRRKQSCIGVDIALAGLDQAEWDTRYAVTRTYYSYVYARQQAKVALDLVNNLQFYRDRVSEQVKLSTGSRKFTQDSVDKITAYLGIAESKKIEAELGIRRAGAGLMEAMGADISFTVAESELPQSKAKVSREQIIRWAVDRRGELAQARLAEQVANLEISAQERNIHLKTPTFAAATDIHARPVPQGFANGEYRPGATSLEMPTLFVGKRHDRMKRATELDERAQAVIEKTTKLIILDADDAFLKWDEAGKKVEKTKDAAKAADNLSVNTRKAFTSTLNVSIEDILTNEVVAAQTKSAYNEARFLQILGLAGMQRATAGGFEPGLSGKTIR